MSINLTIPDIQELKPRITVFGVGGAGGNAVNNMINSGLDGVDFVVANTDAQALALSKANRIVQMGVGVTEGLGAGSHPEVGKAAAEESIDEINDHLSGAHMAFITAGMGGGTGTGAAPVVARAAREQGILTVGVVTKPFHFEGKRRMQLAEDGIDELHRHVDTLIVIPNQNLFRVANDKTTFADAFGMADEVLYSGVACITDLMVKEGLINLDFADVRAVMRGMGKAMMGTGEASGEDRASHAAEAAISNPLLDDVSVQGARGLLISITGGPDLTLYEVDEAASRIREEVGSEANIILGATFDDTLEGAMRVSVVATGTEATMVQAMDPHEPNSNRAPLTYSRPAAQPEQAPAEPEPVPASAEDADFEAAMADAVGERTSAPAAQHDGDVSVEPYFPTTEPAREVDEYEPVSERPVPRAYVPQNAQRPQGGQRMPRTDELPNVGRKMMDEREASAEAGAETRNAPRALFRRLASNVGLNLKQEAEAKQAASGHENAGSRAEPSFQQPAPRQTAPQPSAPQSAAPNAQASRPAVEKPATADLDARNAIESGRQPRSAPAGATGQLDGHGRAQPAAEKPREANSGGEHLEIPAFLRKHG